MSKIEELVSWVVENGQQVGMEAKMGCVKAQAIINAYKLMEEAQDNASIALLEIAIEKYDNRFED